MQRARLKAILTGGSSIAFNARPRSDGGEPFFESRLLRNIAIIKLGDVSEAGQGVLRTLVYFPYDPQTPEQGGRSILISDDSNFRHELERHFGIDKNETRFDADVARLEVFCRIPSFSPFLLRDTFERARVAANPAFFDITDQEAEATRDRLKTRLKPLAALALNRSLEDVGGGQLELLVRKLWQLDDPNFIFPLTRALQIQDADAVDTLYSWIGVSYLQSEFVRRELRVKQLAEWLVKKSMPVENLAASEIREYQTDRQFVRDKLRMAWTAASDVFVRLDKSYRSLISVGGDPRPFVQFMRDVRADIQALGLWASMIDQSLSVFDYWMGKFGDERVSFDMLRQTITSLRSIWVDNESSTQLTDAAKSPLATVQIASVENAGVFAPPATRSR
jgi:hypothetical protein